MVRYATQLKINGRYEQVIVAYDPAQRRICARKVMEFNPHVFDGMVEDQLVAIFANRAEHLLQEEVENLFEHPGVGVSLSSAGWMIQLRSMDEPGTPWLVEVEYLIDPKILFFDEAWDLEVGSLRP